MKQLSLEVVKSSEMEGDILLCEVGGHPKDTEEEQRNVQAEAPPQKRSAVTRVESAEAQDRVSELKWIEEENEEGAELRPECSQRAALGLANVQQQV